MHFLEIFQTTGAIVSFTTGAIALYDRLLRYRPHVSIFAQLEGDAWPILRVTNSAPFDILVSKIVIDPPLLALSQQQTTRAMVDVITKAKITASIKRNESAEFHIINPDQNKTANRAAERIKFKVYWHRSISTVIPPLAATITTSIDDIEERKRATIRAGRRSP
jgi:hypothetical protein